MSGSCTRYHRCRSPDELRVRQPTKDESKEQRKRNRDTMMARRVCIWHRVLDEYVCEAMCIACMDSEGADMRACTKAGKVEVQPGCSNGT